MGGLNDRTQKVAALLERLQEKRAALGRSDEAVNHIPALLVSALNGEAYVGDGHRLSISDATKGADAIRAVHQLITSEVADLEKTLAEEAKRGPTPPLALLMGGEPAQKKTKSPRR